MSLVIGLDHSLTAFGLAAVPVSWELNFGRVRRVTLQTKPDDGPPVARRAALARDVVQWVRREVIRAGLAENSAGWTSSELQTKVCIYIESGIFNARMVDTIRSQERLAAVVEHELWRVLGLRLELAQQRSVRTAFMGPAMSGGRGAGEAAQQLLKAAAPECEDWDEAELDAFLIANWGLGQAGELFFSCSPVGQCAGDRA